MIDIKIADWDMFKSSRKDWNKLVLEMRRPSVFCTWEWIDAWFEYYGTLYEPLILFFYSGRRLRGILPLAKRFIKFEDCIFPVRVLSYCGSRELYSDHIDILCREEDADLCIKEMKRYFTTIYRNWDVIELSHVPEDGRLLAMRNGSAIGHRAESARASSAFFISLKGSFEKYCMRMSGDRRRELRRTMRVLYGKENVTYLDYDPQGSYGITDLFDLHRMRQKRKGNESSFTGDTLINFHSKIVRDFYDKGWLRLAFLCHLDKAVAAIYGYDFCGRFFGYQMGIDPAWERRSVGSVLLYEMIEKSFDKNLLEFDFLRGGETYKGKWADQSRDLINVTVFNSTVLGIAAGIYISMRSNLKQFIHSRINKYNTEKNAETSHESGPLHKVAQKGR